MNYLAMPEQWRAIPDLEGFYDASTHGRIRSVRRMTSRGWRGGTILKPGQLKDGRLVVSIFVPGRKAVSCKVATLVARTWIGPRPAGQHVCHGPAGLTDNTPGNLYYGTPKRNSQDRKRDGTWMAGEQNGRARLTWELVQQIRTQSATGETQVSLAKTYKVSRGAICHITSGRHWVVLGRLAPVVIPVLNGLVALRALNLAVLDCVRTTARAWQNTPDRHPGHVPRVLWVRLPVSNTADLANPAIPHEHDTSDWPRTAGPALRPAVVFVPDHVSDAY